MRALRILAVIAVLYVVFLVSYYVADRAVHPRTPATVGGAVLQ